jgi:hypothetical protein
MNRALFWIAVGTGVGAGIACNDPQTIAVTQLNLDRPVDVAFACYGNMKPGNGNPPFRTAMPVAACASLSPPLSKDPPEFIADADNNRDPNGHILDRAKPVAGQESVQGVVDNMPTHEPAWYAFILQSASGTVAVATWGTVPAEAMAPTQDATHDMLVLDADALTPGKNAISIGEDPVAIATDNAGCFEVTANAGSCDLSELEVNSALDNTSLGRGAPTPVRVLRVPVKNAMGREIRARPAAMVADPLPPVPVGSACPATATGKVYIAYPSCHLVARVDTADGTIVDGIQYSSAGVPTILSGAALNGVTCPDECLGTAGSGAIAPGVRPVALDLRYDPRTSATKTAITNRLAIGADVTGAPGAAPITIVELDPVTSKPMAVSTMALEGNVGVTAVALSPQIGMGGHAGETQGQSGQTTFLITDDDDPGGQGQYVYAVAADGTVRVADVLTTPHRECDTQIDGRFLRDSTIPIATLQCLPIGDPARPRRSGARGPGIEIPDDGVPNSVAIFRGRNRPPATTRAETGMVKDDNGQLVMVTDDIVDSYAVPAPSTWVGTFAVITSTNGTAYVVNVDDDYAPDRFATGNLNNSPVLVIPHQLRDNFTLRNAVPQISYTKTVPDPTSSTGTKAVSITVPACLTIDPLSGVLTGGPRITSPVARALPQGTMADDKLLEVPQIRNVECIDGGEDGNPHPLTHNSVAELAFGAPVAVRDQVFPDLRSVVGETWSLTWQGTLSVDNGTRFVDGPPIRDGQVRVDPYGMHLSDPAHPFCQIGVEPFDIADLRGCDPANRDTDCPIGYTCYVHPKYVNPTNGPSVGACMVKSEAPRLADACRDFLTTRRRYTVGRVESGEVVLLERKHELANTPIDGCDSDVQCDTLAHVARAIDLTADPFLEADQANPTAPRSRWSCQVDPLRAPINLDPAKNKRCVQTCILNPQQQPHFECAVGTACHPTVAMQPTDTDVPGVCLEGVEPPQACLNGPQRYTFRASEAFTVIGNHSGYVHPMIDQNGSCVRDPSLNPSTVQIGRIPFKAPPCACAPDDKTCAATGQLPGGGFEPNPCSLTTPEYDGISSMPAACDQAPASGALASRDAPAIRFRNRSMTMTIVDPFRRCNLAPPPGSPDGTPPTPANLPFSVTGYQLEFTVKAGFQATGTPSTYSLPLVGTSSPVKVVRGPIESIWVIDDGDFLSNSITLASTRGRVYRLESVDVDITNILQ